MINSKWVSQNIDVFKRNYVGDLKLCKMAQNYRQALVLLVSMEKSAKLSFLFYIFVLIFLIEPFQTIQDFWSSPLSSLHCSMGSSNMLCVAMLPYDP